MKLYSGPVHIEMDASIHLITFVDECPVGSLLLLAVASRLAVHRLDSGYVLVIPKIASGAFLFGYFLHCFSREPHDFNYLLASLMRAVLGCQVLWSVAAVMTAGTQFFLRRLCSVRSLRDSRRRRLADEASEVDRKRQAEQMIRAIEIPLPEPPLPREERLRKMAEGANADYNAEVKVLDGLPLDTDERDVLIMRAKQRLLQKLERFGKE